MNARRKLVAVSSVAALAVAALAGCDASAGSSGGARITLSIPDPIDSSVGEAAQHFADEVKDASGGKLQVRVIPNGTSFGGDQEAAVRRVESGSLDATILSTSVYAAFIKEMNALSLPYLFSDTDEVVEYLEGQPGQDLADLVAEKEKTRVLAFLTRTPREVTNSVRPVTEPADLKGMKLRVPGNPLWTDFFGSMGASPTPMDFSEVFTALQTGTIDGQENPVEVPAANKFYQVQKYLSMTNHITDAFVLGISQDKWDGLTSDQQKYLQQAAEVTADFKTTNDEKQAESQIQTLEDNGMEVNELSDAGLDQFKTKARELYPDFEDLIGADFMKETTDFVGQ